MDFGHDLIDNGTKDDYYTPPWVFEGLGLTFDLDVCAPSGGVPWIPAVKSLTIIEDGLVTPWKGKVWMNPPFSNSKPWIMKFIEHGNGLCLVPASNGRWWIDLWQKADAILALPPGMKFVTGGGLAEGISRPVFLAAMGAENVSALKSSGLGHVR